VSIVLNTIHTVSDNLTYGNPRTFHADKDVGHGGLSHFTAENVGGHILVIEVVNSDPSTTKTYAVITIAGENAALAPATLTFEDKNGDRQLDLLVLVNSSTYVWPNDGKAFKEH
jgi:hypothetical protein